MIHRITSRSRAARWALLPALAAGALFAAQPAANARDQQATGTQIDNDLSWHAVGGNYGAHAYGPAYGAYAEAPRDTHVRARVHRDDRDDYRGDER
jgi:hypothetical protein